MKFTLRNYLLVALLFITGACRAQYLSLGINGGWEQPHGDILLVYKGATSMGLHAGYLYGDPEDDGLYGEFGISIATFKTKQDTFYYWVDGGPDYGTATYSNYKTYWFYGGLSYRVHIVGGLEVSPGVDLRFYATNQRLSADDKYVNYDSDMTQSKYGFSPKVTVGYTIKDAFRVAFQYNFNILFSEGMEFPHNSTYNNNSPFETISSYGIKLTYFLEL